MTTVGGTFAGVQLQLEVHRIPCVAPRRLLGVARLASTGGSLAVAWCAETLMEAWIETCPTERQIAYL
jgi:hypothetical protein